MKFANNAGRIRCAFTLVEMLVVIGILTLLLAILLPAISRARDRADATQCLNNSRQIVIAWTMYTQDHADKLPPNIDGRFGGFTNWVAGYKHDPNEATNALVLLHPQRSLLASYLKQPRVFKCPADESAFVRSVAMNCRLNPTRYVGVPPRWVGGGGAIYRTFRSLADVQHPDRVFVTTDEDAVSINDAYFAVDMSNTGTPEGSGAARPYYIIDYPGAYHSRGSTFSFVDGHVQVQPWKEKNTFSEIRAQRFVPAPNRDLEWLQAHSTYRE